jgi:hypothetical protein
MDSCTDTAWPLLTRPSVLWGDMLTAKCVLNLIYIVCLLAGGIYVYMMCEQSVIYSWYKRYAWHGQLWTQKLSVWVVGRSFHGNLLRAPFYSLFLKHFTGNYPLSPVIQALFQFQIFLELSPCRALHNNYKYLSVNVSEYYNYIDRSFYTTFIHSAASVLFAVFISIAGVSLWTCIYRHSNCSNLQLGLLQMWMELEINRTTSSLAQMNWAWSRFSFNCDLYFQTLRVFLSSNIV